MLTKDDLTSLWSARDTEIASDRSTLRLEYSQGGLTKDGFEEVVLNEPRVLYETAVGMLSAKIPLFSIPMKANIPSDEQAKIGKAERFVCGVLNELDTQHFREGKGQWLRELAYWICSGWVCVFPSIDAEGKFRADFYDPLTIFPYWVEGRLQQLMRKVKTTAGDVLAYCQTHDINPSQSLLLAKPDKEVELVSMWEDQLEKGVFNSIEAEGTIIKPATPERFKRIPFLIGLANGTPERDSADWRKYVGQSIISTNRTMYEANNRWVSMLMQMSAQRAFPTLLTTSPQGEAILEKENLGHSNVISLRTGEEVKPLDAVSYTPEINIINSIIGGSLQRGGLPNVIYGGLPFEVSGFALSQMIGAVQYKLNPYITAMQQVLSQLSVEVIDLFKQYGKDIDLSVKNKETGKFYLEAFSKAEIPLITRMEVTVDIGGPTDKLQTLLAGRAALQEPAVLSRETLWRMVIPDIVEDPIAEKARILTDQTESLELVRIIRVIDELRVMAEGLQKQGQGEQARILMGYAQTILNQISTQMAQGGGGNSGQGQPSAGGAGMRGGGRVSPEAVSAAQGQQPSGGMAGPRGSYNQETM